MSKKASLGLGTKLGGGLSSNKADLNFYLKSLTKKQKEVQKKYRSNSVTSISGKPTAASPKDDDVSANLTEDDSDLASLAREFAKEEIQDSPFLKRRTSVVSVGGGGGGGGAGSRRQSMVTPLPEQDAPFISSLVRRNSIKKTQQQTSSALNSFMKFDKKYTGRSRSRSRDRPDSDSDPEISDAVSPSKIASELEEKVRSRRSSLASVASIARSRPESRRASAAVTSSSTGQVSPSKLSNKLSRLQQKAKGKQLKLTMPTSQSPVRKDSGGTGPESAALTASEVSEIPTGSPSPVIAELHVMGIEELELAEIEEEEPQPETSAEEKLPSVKEVKVAKSKDESDESTLKESKSDKERTSHKTDDDQAPDASRGTSSPHKSPPEKAEIPRAKRKHHSKQKKRKTKKRHRRPETESDLSEASSTSATTSSSCPRSSRRHRQHRSHHRPKSSPPASPRYSVPSKRCYYCRQLCDYHRESLGPASAGMPRPSASALRAGRDESVQVGATNVYPGNDHYLFDPTGDILYNAWSTSNIRRKSKFPATASSYPLPAPTSLALSELMKTQLDLTENFLRAQKQLYRSYCDSLEDAVTEQHRQRRRIGTDEPKVTRPTDRTATNAARERLSFTEARKLVEEEMEREELTERRNRTDAQAKSDPKSPKKGKRVLDAAAVNVEETKYESDFEAEEYEDVVTEVEVATAADSSVAKYSISPAMSVATLN